MTVEFNIDDARKMLADIGICPDGKVQKIFTSECVKRMDRYTPFDSGILKNTVEVGKDYAIYRTPYARNMYYGIVMVDPVTKAAGFKTQDGWKSRKGVKKIPSDREYSYGNGNKRGKLWDRRMWENEKDVITHNVKKAIGGKK